MNRRLLAMVTRTLRHTATRWWPDRTWPRRLALLLLVVLLAGPIPYRAEAAGDQPRVHPQLLREAKDRPNDIFRVIVGRINRDVDADRNVAAKGNKKVKEVAAEGFVAEVRGKDIAELGKHKAVKYVAPDAVMIPTGSPDDVDPSRLATLYDRVVRATDLWRADDGQPAITGEGVGVAVLDTGIKNSLLDFTNGISTTNRIVKQALFNSNTKSMADGMGHGTHVAGIIAGNSWWNTNSAVQGKYIGIAPRANLINVKVSDDTGMSYISDVINGIDWVVQNRQTYNIRVMNLSMISSVAESYVTSMLDAAVERAWFSGILVTVSAGNQGPDALYFPPANDPFVITVGAADPMKTSDRGDDTIAPWSSYGTSQDGIAKPDVVAPGRYIVSTLASNGSTLAKTYPDRIVDGSYIRMSGTSMAAPVVAGIAALAFQAHPEWTNDQVKWLLMRTARKLGSVDLTTGNVTLFAGQGAGEVNARAVVAYPEMPGFANQGLAITSLLAGPDGATAYNNSTSSWSTSSWSTSSWSTSSWSTSSWSTSSWSTSSWSTSSWSTSSWSSSAGVE